MGKPVKQRDLGVIQADIIVAEATLATAEKTDNKNLLCMAGYHMAQAAEKCLKAIIRTERHDLYKGVCNTHDITRLMHKAEISRPGTTVSHTMIAENSEKLSEFNNMRYGLTSVTTKELNALLDAVKSFEKELEQDFERTHPNKKQNARNAQNEWNGRPKADLTIVREEKKANRKGNPDIDRD